MSSTNRTRQILPLVLVVLAVAIAALWPQPTATTKGAPPRMPPGGLSISGVGLGDAQQTIEARPEMKSIDSESIRGPNGFIVALERGTAVDIEGPNLYSNDELIGTQGDTMSEIVEHLGQPSFLEPDTGQLFYRYDGFDLIVSPDKNAKALAFELCFHAWMKHEIRY